MSTAEIVLEKLMFEREINVFSSENQERIHRAYAVAEYAHAEQRRPQGEEYIHHPLRVALTVLREFRITDADLVCAALLHDVIEDQSERLIEKYGEEDDEHEALYVIERLFGHRVARTVKGLSTPEVLAPTQEAKNVFYTEHIREAIQDPAVSVVKLADFYDNAFRIDEVLVDRRPGYIAKYGPVIRDVWIPFLHELPEAHPLYPVKMRIHQDIEVAMKTYGE